MNARLTGFLKWVFLVLFVTAMLAGFFAARTCLRPKTTPGVTSGEALGFREAPR